ncbi:hypothetical protein [Euzebyella saccharophila]|uniref:Uncharacterized protein n=1 Tax=Euzebyella saccharophila TaxID=679664 RepID=A0ABV8JNF7_9FLAO|nr:hypothetical protein [Euzebyella saccharophila]
MKVIALLLVLAFQWFGYQLFNHLRIKNAKTFLLLLVIANYLWVIPLWFYPERQTMDCGLTTLGIHLFFIFTGVPLALFLHITHYFKTKKLSLNEF